MSQYLFNAPPTPPPEEDEYMLEEVSLCLICLDAYTNPTAIRDCGHIFCNACIYMSLQFSNRCPVCRHEITGEDPFIRVDPLQLNNFIN